MIRVLMLFLLLTENVFMPLKTSPNPIKKIKKIRSTTTIKATTTEKEQKQFDKLSKVSTEKSNSIFFYMKKHDS